MTDLVEKHWPDLVQRKGGLDALIALPGYAYIATPYTNYPHGHAAAAYDAARATAALMRRGICALSPIAHSHAVGTVGNLSLVDGDFWQHQDAPLVEAASACVVVMLDGWVTSRGTIPRPVNGSTATRVNFSALCTRRYPSAWRASAKT
ncbi:MAG: Uncharacterized protein FD152_3676 [Xanthobacteraceae bacterium]|nr:MAG: Uncharacterized protein FD152_3676 [Xanthobacteraceae bacterium]